MSKTQVWLQLDPLIGLENASAASKADRVPAISSTAVVGNAVANKLKFAASGHMSCVVECQGSQSGRLHVDRASTGYTSEKIFSNAVIGAAVVGELNQYQVDTVLVIMENADAIRQIVPGQSVYRLDMRKDLQQCSCRHCSFGFRG